MSRLSQALHRDHRMLQTPWVQGLLLLLVTLACHLNGLRGTWLYDDHNDILGNRLLRELWPLHHLFFHSEGGHWIFHTRPFTWLTFAVDYRLGDGHILPFHLTSLAIHAAAVLLLWALVRWALDRTRSLPSHPAALLVALAWGIHPLQTGAVTYIVQRYESLASLGILLTLWCFIRSQESPRPRLWQGLSVFSCLLALLSKEIAVATPLLVLLFDRAFVTGSFRESLRRHWQMYVGFLGCLLLFLFIQTHAHSRASFAGGAMPTPWWQYALNQPGVILYYLRLVIWPHPLLLDAAWIPARTVLGWLPQLILVLGLLGASLWAVLRHPKVGFLAMSFWLILAPTSSVMPILDMAVQHRMYLPMAAIMALGATGLCHAWQRWPGARIGIQPLLLPLACAAFTLAALGTILRNEDFRRPTSLWQQNLDRRPHSWRAMINAAQAYEEEGNRLAAFALYQQAVRDFPNLPHPLANLAGIYADIQEYEKAMALTRAAIRIDPGEATYVANLGAIALLAGDLEEADRSLTAALQKLPTYSRAQQNFATLRERQGRFAEGEAAAREAIRLSPRRSAGHWILGRLLCHQRKTAEGMAQFRQAIALEPQPDLAPLLLVNTLIDLQHFSEALKEARQALGSAPQQPDLRLSAAWILATAPDASLRNGAEALQLLAFEPTRGAQAWRHQEVLAAARAEVGEFTAARTLLESALAQPRLPRDRKESMTRMLESIRHDHPHRDLSREWLTSSRG